MAGQEREEGTQRYCQRARPSLGSDPSLGSALLSLTLPETSTPGCAGKELVRAAPGTGAGAAKSLQSPSTTQMGVGGGGRAHTHSLSVLRGIFLGTLRSASP